MKMVMRFERNGKLLTRFEKELKKPEDFDAADEEGRALFRKENPGVLLMDGVMIIYDSAG